MQDIKNPTKQRAKEKAKETTKNKGRVGRIVIRFFVALFALLAAIVIFLLGIITVLCKGPSPTIRDLFVTTVMETSAAKFLAHMYFSDDEITAIQAKNAVVVTAEVTDIKEEEFVKKEDAPPLDTIEEKDVTGTTFKGKMLIVYDPSRVSVATAPVFGTGHSGLTVSEYVKETNAVIGINGGGFADPNGMGQGGEPTGLVISNNKMLNGNVNTKSQIVGFDKNNKLVVGTLSGQQCLDLGIRDAVSFGPSFIINGKAAPISGTSGGLNPRSVIGQREDGAVLILAIDGRQPSSMGATYKDCIDIMLEYGAINAGNLDGGSSTVLVYNGEIINSCASLYGPRKLPTAFIVK